MTPLTNKQMFLIVIASLILSWAIGPQGSTSAKHEPHPINERGSDHPQTRHRRLGNSPSSIRSHHYNYIDLHLTRGSPSLGVNAKTLAWIQTASIHMEASLEIKGKSIEYDIRTLAGQFALPVPQAHDLLWDEIHHLEQVARIRDFILILALKTVKDHLRDTPVDLAGLA